LLSDTDPKAVDPVEFRGRQYDLGLAWVHFPEGLGGLGLPPSTGSGSGTGIPHTTPHSEP